MNKWDPIKLRFFTTLINIFKFFCKYWPDDGPLSMKIVASNGIEMKYYIFVTDGVHV